MYLQKRNKNIKHKIGNFIALCSGEIDVLKFMVKDPQSYL